MVVECDAPTSNLPAVLALPRYAIAKRGGGKLAGSGPFAINRWDPGKKLDPHRARRLLGQPRLMSTPSKSNWARASTTR